MFSPLPKLTPGDRVAIVSPSFAAPGVFPEVYDLGCQRLREVFKLEPISFPATATPGASAKARSEDLVAAFTDPSIKAVISSIGGNDQVTYIKHLPSEPFRANPKPFFGFSDNTHFAHFLFQLGIPSYYGGSLFTQYARPGVMDSFTIDYLQAALFTGGHIELQSSSEYSDVDLDWNEPSNLTCTPPYETNPGWYWDGGKNADGILWGGCVESIDEILRHHIALPSLEQSHELVLMLETSEELPTAEMVYRTLRALGEHGILSRIQGVVVGRPKVWEFMNLVSSAERAQHQEEQRAAVLRALRTYNKDIPIVQNLDFGHTNPQIPMPLGRKIELHSDKQRIFVEM